MDKAANGVPEPQFKPEELYVSPFTGRRRFDEETGRRHYVPLERNVRPSGVRILDEYVQYVSADGFFSRRAFAESHGLTAAELAVVCRALTGMSADELFHYLMLRLADDLLRYTSLPLSRVATLCGANTQQNLCVVMRKEYDCTPLERRYALQRPGDEDLFCVEKAKDC